MKTGIELIADERKRGIEVEGFDAAHDDEHTHGEIVAAALSYVMIADGQIKNVKFPPCFIPKWWPWERSWWKPKPDPIPNLVVAGALIAAEIDRLQRKRDIENSFRAQGGTS